MQNLSFTVPHTAHQTDHNQLQRKKGLFPTPAPTLTRFITFIFQSHLPRVHLAEPHVKFCTMLAGRYPSVPGCEIDLKQYSRPTVECVWFWDIFFLFVRDFLFRCPGLTGLSVPKRDAHGHLNFRPILNAIKYSNGNYFLCSHTNSHRLTTPRNRIKST